MNRINRDIFALSVPAIVTNITTPLLGLVDTGLTGHMGGAQYLAAIAVGSTVFNMLYWTVSFLRMSASGLTSQAWGRKDAGGQSLILYREVITAVVIGILFASLSPLYGDALIRLVDAGSESFELTVRYFRITILGAPAVLLTYALSGWFLGRQNSRVTMWNSFLINIVNIGLSCALVFAFRMKIEGVAIGTLVAQWSGAVALSIAAVRTRPVKVEWREILNFVDFRNFFRVNAAIFLRTLCMIAVTVWFTRIGASQGSEILAVNAMLMQLFMLFSYFMDGFAFAGEALVGRDVGASNAPGLKLTVRWLFGWSALLAIVFTIIYIFAGEWILGRLTDDAGMLARSHEYAAWSFAIPLCGFAAFAWDGIFIGAMLNRMMLLSMGFAACVFFVVYSLTFKSMGNHGLWLAFLCYLAVRGVSQSVIWRMVPLKLN